MKLIKYSPCFLVMAMALFLSSCTKEDAYKKFMEGGEIRYAGRADSVIVHPGKGRIQLSVVLSNDPLINKVKAFWNDGRDSAVMTVKRTLGKDTANLLIKNLSEGNYNFSVYTYDSKNHSSVVSNVSGTVYGDSYYNSLVNRRLKDLGFTATDAKLQLNWGAASIGEIGTELNYLAANGSPKVLIVPAKEVLTLLSDYKDGSIIKYRTLYKPDSASIDTFARDYASVTIPVFERQLDKSKFKEYILPSDSRTAYEWLMPYLWDESYNPPGFATTNGMPQWFTFDTGVSTSLSRFKTWQANDRLYTKESIKKFEVWGSDAPNPDGSWASWTKLMTCESLKPSGLPAGQFNAEDIAYAKAGEEFVFPAGLPKVRYIRIKVLETWGGSNFITMEEITFWTHDR